MAFKPLIARAKSSNLFRWKDDPFTSWTGPSKKEFSTCVPLTSPNLSGDDPIHVVSHVSWIRTGIWMICQFLFCTSVYMSVNLFTGLGFHEN